MVLAKGKRHQYISTNKKKYQRKIKHEGELIIGLITTELHIFWLPTKQQITHSNIDEMTPQLNQVITPKKKKIHWCASIFFYHCRLSFVPVKCVKVANTPVSIRWQILAILSIKVKLQRELITVINLQNQSTTSYQLQGRKITME